jgi:hypothetical protein
VPYISRYAPSYSNTTLSLSVETGILLFLFFLYFIFSPFYVFSSGYPQPADFVLFLAIALSGFYFLTSRKSSVNKVYLVGLGFAFYALVINIVHYVFYPDIRFILTALIYVFNISIFIFTCFLIQKHPHIVRNTMLYGIVLTVVSQFLFVHFIPSDHPFRATGTFNNPNQLAYWVLLTAALLIVLKSHLKFTLLDIAILGVLFYIQMLSLSKAGIITLSLLYFISFIFITLKSKLRILILPLTAIAVIFSATYFVTFTSAVDLSNFKTLDTAVSRILSIGEERDDSLDGRGYTRLTHNAVFLVLGAGEGAFWRHSGGGYNQELHSGLATIIFSYGLVGMAIFFMFLYGVVRKTSLFFILIFMIVMMFGFTHQNFRFSLYWVYLAVLYMTPVFLYYKKQDK